ncbi:uncharacterized protein Dmoj_GI25922 [Drosophila mojavensis]|uniref:ACB domain-containing protein n=1 Tax=Drosophila mojavensis TaxID=7230 RepID=A0A0Q9XMU0_DROMO|nr:uncharacterized protein Dmoj_GI25922 [Drosophila mojavensis]
MAHSSQSSFELAKKFSKKPKDSDFLKLYGLFEQATIGDVNIDKTGLFDLKKSMYEPHRRLTSRSTRSMCPK